MTKKNAERLLKHYLSTNQTHRANLILQRYPDLEQKEEPKPKPKKDNSKKIEE